MPVSAQAHPVPTQAALVQVAEHARVAEVDSDQVALQVALQDQDLDPTGPRVAVAAVAVQVAVLLERLVAEEVVRNPASRSARSAQSLSSEKHHRWVA